MLRPVACIFVGFVATGNAASDCAWIDAAQKLIAAQSAVAIRDSEGGLNRRFSLQDLDRDGTFEVLETVSHYEDGLEFMNVELAPAFEWTSVYRLDAGAYRESTSDFKSFLLDRRSSYVLWLALLHEPSTLSDDSRQLIGHNRDEFVAVVRGYIARVDEALRHVRSN